MTAVHAPVNPPPHRVTMTLAELPVRAPGRVLQVREPGALGERLLEMGLVPGTPVVVLRRGLLGDPLQIALRGTMLSLRRAQAQQIDVNQDEP